MLPCEVFAMFTIIVTALWVYFGRDWSFRTLAWAMFFPGLFAPWFLEPGSHSFLYITLGLGQDYTKVLQMSILAGMMVILTLMLVLGVNYVTGWGVLDEHAKVDDDLVGAIIPGFLRAAGEEIGWRCFLLPCLLQNYSPFTAFLISGIVWGLYHVPVMILLTQKLKPPHPWLTVLVQSAQCILHAFPIGWLAVKSGFSLWAPTMMHFTWNRLNPALTGSIYTQKMAKVKGQQWLINGEGLAGCIALLPFAIGTFWNLYG